MSELKPVYATRCKVGDQLFADIDEAVTEYRRRLKTTGNQNRCGITIAVEMWFRHKRGDGRQLQPCPVCGGGHE